MEETKGKVCEGGSCGMGGCCSAMKGSCWYHVVRWVLGIAIIVIVFSLGVKVGEFKATFGSGYGRHMMHASYGGGYAYPMMQNGYGGMMGGTTGQ